MPSGAVPVNVTDLSGRDLQRPRPRLCFDGTQKGNQQLRDAQFALDVQLHNLRSEFLSRESKLRQDYLDRVAEITAA
jgi:hypothetical protein